MNDAPAKISMIMQVMRVVPITLCQKACHDKEPDHQAMPKEPSTPHAAHSVAVAQPNNSVKNTRRISRVQGMRLADSRNRSRQLMGGSAGGVLSGLPIDQAAIYPE